MEAAAQIAAIPARRSARAWQVLWFLLHLAAVYVIVRFCTPWLAGWTHGTLLPLMQYPTTSSRFEFLFSHVFAFSFVSAFLAGLINARFRHEAAQFVWIVPTAILAYKLATFPAASVLRSQSSNALHQYFGGGFLIPEFGNWREFWEIVSSNPDMTRGMAQMEFTAPFYGGVAYSLAAWVGRRIELNRMVADRVHTWEESKFGTPSESHDPPLASAFPPEQN